MIKKNLKSSRNESLVVLSHEHHHALIFSSRLKKSERVSDEILRDYILDFWNKYLVNHFKIEEELFLTVLTNKELKNQFIEEHRIIRELIVIIENSEETVYKFALQLSRLITNHVRFEERTLFNWLQDNLSQSHLNEIGEGLSNIEITAHEYSDKFWM